MNLIHFGIRLLQNKMWKKWRAVNTFRLHCNKYAFGIYVPHTVTHIRIFSTYEL